jgi:integrase
MWPLFLFGLYSLLRPNEYCALRWEWIKDEVISIPAEVMKMRRPFQVPITRQIKEILTAQHARKIGDYVFYSPLHPDKPYNIGSYEIFLRKHGFKGILVPHGLRSIGRTWMAENGARHDVAEMCLAHQVGNAVEMAYNRANLLKMRLETMQQWNDFIDECLAVEMKGKGHYFDF